MDCNRLTAYCSACNDPRGSSEACDGRNLSSIQAWQVCAIKNACRNKQINKKLKLKFLEGPHKDTTWELTIRDHCGTSKTVDVWMGVKSHCTCNIAWRIEVVSIK